MSLPRRSGFTLVELLTVVIILGLLLALLLPAIGRMRESTRETVCRDQLRNVAQAVEAFAEKQNQYPGWRHNFPTRDSDGKLIKAYMPWVVPILEHIDRKDTGNHIKATQPANIQWPWVEILVCPSDRDKVEANGPVLSYVGNAGRPDVPPKNSSGDPIDYRSNAIFLDLYNPNTKQQTPAFIIKADGKVNTLLLSENLNATSWGKVGPSQIQEYDHCIVFHDSENADRRINSTPSSGAAPIDLARPSSPHHNGANIATAAGNVRLLESDVDYEVYKALLKVDSGFADPDYP